MVCACFGWGGWWCGFGGCAVNKQRKNNVKINDVQYCYVIQRFVSIVSFPSKEAVIGSNPIGLTPYKPRTMRGFLVFGGLLKLVISLFYVLNCAKIVAKNNAKTT